jgi:lipid-A-disaccharide synthase-like uncharacterized protein
MTKVILDYSGETGIWLFIGLISQIFFFLRFLIQWVISEKYAQSIIPVSFWYLSIIGALGLLSYALYRRDPVFIIGQLTGLFVYKRNLILIKKSDIQ